MSNLALSSSAIKTAKTEECLNAPAVKTLEYTLVSSNLNALNGPLGELPPFFFFNLAFSQNSAVVLTSFVPGCAPISPVLSPKVSR